MEERPRHSISFYCVSFYGTLFLLLTWSLQEINKLICFIYSCYLGIMFLILINLLCFSVYCDKFVLVFVSFGFLIISCFLFVLIVSLNLLFMDFQYQKYFLYFFQLIALYGILLFYSL